MKVVIAHIYGNTKESVNEVTSILADSGYEIAYETEQLTNASIIKEVADEQTD